jgi:hypothetical protein
MLVADQEEERSQYGNWRRNRAYQTWKGAPRDVTNLEARRWDCNRDSLERLGVTLENWEYVENLCWVDLWTIGCTARNDQQDRQDGSEYSVQTSALEVGQWGYER